MAKKRILIVDDEPGFTRLVRLSLEATGQYEVREENDGTQALASALEFRPDFIFLDVVMPETDGGDVAAQLRKSGPLTHVPIVFLTAIVSQREASTQDTIGGYPFLSKPVALDALAKCIEDHTQPR
jgi:two-component system OmpR family response regulator